MAKDPVKPEETKKKEDGKTKPEDELSEEDQQLKTELEMLVERLKEPKLDLYKPTLEALRKLIRESTSSMTSVPKPLKFLRPHYPDLVALFDKWAESETKRFFADILSLLGMSYADENKRDTLKYCLLGSAEPAGSWGHEYVRHLSSELIAEYAYLSEKDQPIAHIVKKALEIVPFFLKHNAEADACDLLIDIEAIDKLPSFVDKDTYARVCLYIVSCAPYLAPPDDLAVLHIAHSIYRTMDQLASALLVAIKLNDPALIKLDFDECSDPLLKRQLAFILARRQIFFEDQEEQINDILCNTQLSEHFLTLARDLDVVEPKTPEDVYKSHLENVRTLGGASKNVDSAKQNLASTFVNAFVNAGFGNDKLMMAQEENANWIYKNKEHGMLSAAASLGLIHLWDVENGLTHIDKYLYSQDDNIKAGALLAIGLVSSGVRNESDPALALLSEQVNASSAILRSTSIVGLGIAYAGSAREDVYDLLVPLVSDHSVTMEISSLAALSLGLIFVGSCHGELTSTILQTLMERDEAALKDPYAKFMGLGLAFLFLGKQDAADAPIETLKVIEHPIAKQLEVLVEIVAYAGTGNVLKIQKMLHHCNDHLDAEKEDVRFQSFAVLGIALIGIGEEIGSEMALRTFNHLMHYGEPVIRRAVPLALGLLCASNPVVNLLDLLSKYSHDNDAEVSQNAIFAMGLIGAGTNNARLAQMLRQLAAYYHKEPNHLFLVRISQGLLHMGKGTLSISPFALNRSVLCPSAIAGLLTVLSAFTEPGPSNTSSHFILGNAHYLLYFLVPAMYPRFLLTLDENLKHLPVTVRVGQAVDVVGQAGRPKTITGFQTHSTPVLLGYSERAELGSEEYLGLSPVLEGFVILKKNPEWMDEDGNTGK